MDTTTTTTRTRTRKRTTAMNPFPTTTIFVWWFLLFECCESLPIRDNWNGFCKRANRAKSSFSWEASIAGRTGMASSRERTGPFSLRPRTKDEERLVIETSRRFVDTWSDFLCKGSVSLGILECDKEESTRKKSKIMNRIRIPRWRRKRNTREAIDDDKAAAPSSSALIPRFVPFPVKLLEFGTAVESSPPPPSSSRCPSSMFRKSRKSGGDDDNEGTVLLGSWDIPLQGGALILEDEDDELYPSSRGREYLGKLTFAIVRCKEQRDDETSYQIRTGIVDYRPWLAGGGYPSTETQKVSSGLGAKIRNALVDNRETTTKRLCHGFYLSTQSMVHAYVTWRFHKAWKQTLETAVTTANNSVQEE